MRLVAVKTVGRLLNFETRGVFGSLARPLMAFTRVFLLWYQVTGWLSLVEARGGDLKVRR
jgi:hypothetical protein